MLGDEGKSVGGDRGLLGSCRKWKARDKVCWDDSPLLGMTPDDLAAAN